MDRVSGAGIPSEDLLDSAQPERTPGSRPWLLPALAVGLVLAGLFGFQALQPEPVPDSSETASVGQTSEEPPADPSLVDASARRLYGDVGVGGAQNFSTAIRAANAVVDVYCRSDIPSWSASLISSGESYDRAIFLMTPANRRYGTFVVQVELTWIVDQYSFAVVAGHVEQCA